MQQTLEAWRSELEGLKAEVVRLRSEVAALRMENTKTTQMLAAVMTSAGSGPTEAL